MYKIRETEKAIEDVSNLAIYMIEELGNQKAGTDFLDKYEKQIENLSVFPYGYRELKYYYRGYEIRKKSYDAYNIFFVINEQKKEIIILRVLNARQNWEDVISHLTP